MNDMTENKTNVETGSSVIAIVQEDDKLKAVEIRSGNGTFDLLWTRSSEGTNWAGFAAECGISAEPGAQPAESEKLVVVGFHSAGAIFHRVTVPEVGPKEVASIVQLQAETRLPLPADQIELAWRADPPKNGQMGITMAVARREQLRRFIASIQSLKPGCILLDCEGIVHAWRTAFAGTEHKAIILSAARRSTHVCLVEDGRLSNAVVLDAGVEDLISGGVEQTEAMEMFTQDMRGVLELFGCANQGDVPIFVLSDGSAGHVSIVSALRMVQINARVALPHVHKPEADGGIGAEGLYDYRTPIGLALLALEEDEEALNIFERLYRLNEEKEQKKPWLYSPKVAAVAAGLMVALLLIVVFAVDVASPGAIDKSLKASISDVDMDQLLAKNNLRQAIARQRPDLLELLKIVNDSGGRGIMLNSILFKKGQPVSVTGQANSNDDLSKFEKSLQANKIIGEVNPPTATTDSKTRKITFTMTFHYKNFTKKTTAAAKTRS